MESKRTYLRRLRQTRVPARGGTEAMFKSLFAKISPTLIVREAKAGAKKITPNEQRLVDYCALGVDEAQKRLATGPNGLTTDAVENLRREFGPNEIKVGEKSGVLGEILLRFKNPLVIQLLVIAAVSVFTGDIPSAVVVGGHDFPERGPGLCAGASLQQGRREAPGDGADQLHW